MYKLRANEQLYSSYVDTIPTRGKTFQAQVVEVNKLLDWVVSVAPRGIRSAAASKEALLHHDGGEQTVTSQVASLG